MRFFILMLIPVVSLKKKTYHTIMQYGQVKSNIPDQQEAKVADLHLL